MLYFLFYFRNLQKKFIKRLNDLKGHTYEPNEGLISELQEENPVAASQARMLCHIADAHLFTNTKQKYFPLGEKMFKRLLMDLEAAEKFIYYEPGFVHAKSYLVDDDYAMIGTINLDYRSLVHHFENGVWMYKCEVIKNLKADMVDTLGKSIEVMPDMLKINLFQRFIYSVVRIFAPML